MLSSAVFNVKAGLHWSLSTSRQIAPFWLLTLGCLRENRPNGEPEI